MCRLPPDAPWPVLGGSGLASVTRTKDELSVVCASASAPPGARVEDGWRAFALEGPIPFAEVGVLAGLASTLAASGLSLFALSTFDTDYVLVKEGDVQASVAALRAAGFAVGEGPP